MAKKKVTLGDLYSSEELEVVTADLEAVESRVGRWVDGEAVDGDLARYAAMALMSLATRADEAKAKVRAEKAKSRPHTRRLRRNDSTTLPLFGD